MAMMNEQTGGSPPTLDRRDQVVTELCDHFAAGHLELDELERRLTAVDQAADLSQLEALLSDLPARTRATVPAPAERTSAALPTHEKSRGWAVAVMSGHTRRGRWTPPAHLYTVAVMGGVNLDFREARLAAGVTEITAVALMGGVDIVVPPGLPVEVRGFGLMGGVDHVEQHAEEGAEGGPRLQVTAFAVMGGVTVKARSPESDEGAGESRRERRRARRARRHR